MIKLLPVAVHVAVNYASTKTKQLIFVEAGPYFDIKYTCLFPIHNRYKKVWWILNRVIREKYVTWLPVQEWRTKNLRPPGKNHADMWHFIGYVNVSAIKSYYKNNDCFYKDIYKVLLSVR